MLSGAFDTMMRCRAGPSDPITHAEKRAWVPEPVNPETAAMRFAISTAATRRRNDKLGAISTALESTETC
jgi:hypothetical protein